MLILKSVYYDIMMSAPIVPPESGGIMGAKDDVVIEYFTDSGRRNDGYSYFPDIEKLNRQVDRWSDLGISLSGFYHTHTPMGTGLSAADVQYICQIMNSVQHVITSMYFPIVIPKQTMIVYKAQLIGELVITEEKIVLVD